MSDGLVDDRMDDGLVDDGLVDDRMELNRAPRVTDFFLKLAGHRLGGGVKGREGCDTSVEPSPLAGHRLGG